MNHYSSLNEMAPGDHAVIRLLTSTGSMRRRLLDIGLVEGTDVECLGRSPSGDPTAFFFRGSVFAIRSEDCANIWIQKDSK